MSRRVAPPKAAPTNRLTEVLAVGLQQVSINAKIKQLDKKLLQDGVKPGQGIKKNEGLNEALKRAQANTTTFQQDVDILTDCLDFIDAYTPSDGSLESQNMLMCIGTVRCLQHYGICDEAFAQDFFQAADTFLAYLVIADELPSATAARAASIMKPTPTAALFNEQRVQIRRTVFANAAMSTLIGEYFGNLRNIVQYVNAGEWPRVREALITILPAMTNMVFQMMSYIPAGMGLGNDVLRELSTNFANAAATWGRLPLAFGFGLREGWRETAIRNYDYYRYGWSALGEMSRPLWSFLVERDVRAAGRHVGSILTGGLGSPVGVVEGVLKQLWIIDNMTNPIRKISAFLALILFRAASQANLYQIKNVEKYIEVNSIKEGRRWKNELIRAAHMQGLGAQVKAARRKLYKKALKEWRIAHKALRLAMRNKPRLHTSLVTAAINPVSEVSAVAYFLVEYQAWRNQVNDGTKKLDEAVTTMINLQSKYYTDGQMAAAAQALDNEDSSDDDDGPPENGGGGGGAGDGGGLDPDDYSSDDGEVEGVEGGEEANEEEEEEDDEV